MRFLRRSALAIALLAAPSAAAADTELAPPRARVIVQLRASNERVMSAAGAPSASMDAPAVAALFQGHGVRSATALFGARSAGDSVMRSSAAPVTRARRAPRGARRPDLSQTYVLELTDAAAKSLDQTLAALRADPRVRHVEAERTYRKSYVPNDPRYASRGSWGQPYDDLWGLKAIGTTAAWDVARGNGVIVAVVDSGVDYRHPDIDGNIWINPGEIAGNGQDDDGNGYVDDVRGWDFVGANGFIPTPDNDPMDVDGHGTHVAGTIAAEGDNSLGVVGVAWRARVMAVRALDDFGSAPTSVVASAIVYAADQGAHVINASLGAEGRSQVMQDAVDYAHALGVVFVAAAGNANQDAMGHSPANVPNAVTVAATDPFDQKAYFSNYGPKIDVAAPGVDILSLERGSAGYVRLQGTSMAAPHVSGVAALILERHPGFTNEDVRQVLRASGADFGTPGRDGSYGYGRLRAAEAVAIDEVLQARILTPARAAVVQGRIAVTGTASGASLTRYVLEAGAGETPASWTLLQEGVAPVVAGTLGTFDASVVSDGTYTLRLRAISTSGQTFVDETTVDVRYLAITAPAPSPAVSLTHLAKAGTTIAVAGRAVGPSFRRYRLEWAMGRDATSGWSTAGITLANGGTTPVTGGALGTWSTPPFISGEHTIRLVVENDGFESATSVTVYLETDLASPIWPRFVPHSSAGFESPVPVKDASGATRLVVCGAGHLEGAGECVSFHDFATGASTSVRLSTLTVSAPPSAGNLDAAPGDEVLVPDGGALQIFTADLRPVRTIWATSSEHFARDMTSLADLDGDGVHEILAVGRGGTWGFPQTWGSLHVYRANGQLYSNRYPLPIDPPAGAAGHVQVNTLAVDLDRDGTKEILLAVHDSSYSQYVIRAFTAEGAPYAAWSFAPVMAAYSWAPIAADLDRDGSVEIVVADGTPGASELPRLRVLDSRGALKPGWPQLVNIGFGIQHAPGYSIGDLDRDQRDEIVIGVRGGVQVFRHDGSPYGFFQFFSYDHPGHTIIADVNNDTYPDIVVRYDQVGQYRGVNYSDVRFRAIAHNGLTIKEWPLFGLDGRQPARAAMAVGEFTGDGVLDVAVRYCLLEGGGAGGGIAHGAFMMWNLRTPFREASVDWPLFNHDPGNGRVRGTPSAPPTVRVGAVADAHVRDGAAASTNFGSAPALEVKTSAGTGNNRIAYLKFPLDAIDGGVASARLRVYGRRTTENSVGHEVFAVADATWSEGGLTWNNRPALGPRQGGGVVVSPTAAYYEWNVTELVRAQKAAGASTVSLALKMGAPVDHSPDTFHSREAASHPPELVVTVGGADEPLSGHYKIVARHSGKAVVVQNASTANGADVFQWTYGGSATNDEWLFTALGGGYYRITARHSGRALVVKNASTANAGDVIQWSYTSGAPANDEWRVEGVPGGYFRLLNRHSGKALNVAGAGTSNGTNVDQWSWANVPQQQFQLVAVP